MQSGVFLDLEKRLEREISRRLFGIVYGLVRQFSGILHFLKSPFEFSEKVLIQLNENFLIVSEIHSIKVSLFSVLYDVRLLG